jgi:hypothetical protein
MLTVLCSEIRFFAKPQTVGSNLNSKMVNMNLVHLQIQLQELHCDSKIGKDRHFIAANRKNNYNKKIGLTVVLINVLIGSSVLTLLEYDDFGKKIKEIFVSLLSFAAASFAAMQTFFNYSKDIENHRKIGNQYLEVARDADDLLSKFKDKNIEPNECLQQYEELVKKYKNINREGESCPNSTSDYKAAYEKNKTNKERIRKIKTDHNYQAN